ncbi:MAG: molecular chaperone HtpG [Candidatus Muiribacteriota bacterium]
MTQEMEKEKNKNHEEFKFQAEISKVLDIVINSLYTDKSIFIRELISNSSDALEKLRYISLTEKNYKDSETPLEIHVDFDEKENKIIFKDTGVGMTKNQLKTDLGTVAHSGVLEYISKAKTKEDLQLIGQFGVGFYSAFMVAEKVVVKTSSYAKNSKSYKWESDGKNTFTIDEIKNHPRGTTIEIFLKEDCKEFTNADTVKETIKTHSNFISFPIFVKDERINTIDAIWTKAKSEITDEQYNEFYKFISNDMSDPKFRLHFKTDAPLAIDALLFIPETNVEKMGFRQLEDSEVSLYCKKILIDSKVKNILPKWLRFVKGVVDSPDLPLNISREALQDSAVITKIRNILTKRVLKLFSEKAKKEEEKYLEFYKEFSAYLKEGIVQDFQRKDDISKLLRYESMKEKKYISIDEYIKNKKEDQKEIYYMTGSSYEALEASPYVEMFRKKDVDVLFAYEPVDDFVFQNLSEYNGTKIVSADSAKLDIADEEKKENVADIEALAKWIKDEVLKDKIKEVKLSSRLVDSPALLTSEGMTQGMQKFMSMMNKQQGMGANMGAGMNDLEINPDHPIIEKLAGLRATNEEFARELTEQIYDNAVILAGLNTDFRKYVQRMNKIIEKSI